MHRDPRITLIEALEFCGYGPVDNHIVGEAVDFCQADNLRELERSNFFAGAALKNKARSNNAAKVRSAKIGDYVNHLSLADIEYVDGIERRLGNPFKHLSHDSKTASEKFPHNET
jgi:hypothetical protein